MGIKWKEIFRLSVLSVDKVENRRTRVVDRLGVVCIGRIVIILREFGAIIVALN